MSKLIERVQSDATFWLVLIFVSASVLAAYFVAFDFSQKIRSSDLTAAARAQSDLLTAARSFYSREVVEKLKGSRDVFVSHDYHGQDLVVPAPVSMTLGLEEELKSIGASSAIRMVSAYPWPWRETRVLDSFEQDALVALEANPGEPFQAFVNKEEGLFFKSAQAVRMEESCVGCHNSHPDSPKTDWKEGDVRGLQIVSIPAGTTYDQGAAAINTLIVALGVAFFSALALTWVLTSQRQRAMGQLAAFAAEERNKNEELNLAIQRAEAGEAQVSAIVETMLDGVLTIARTGQITSANPASLQMFGGESEAALLALNICDLLPETENSGLPFECCKSADLGQGEHRFATENQRLETYGRRLDGIEYPVEVSLTKAGSDETGPYTALVRDLTAQKAAAAKLKQAETRLIDAIESLPDGFVLYDADDQLVICNSKYKEFYRSSADLIEPGRSFESLIREGAQRGQYQLTDQQLDDWVAMRMDRHRNPGAPMEQHLDDGRWLRVIESRTREGGLVGFRVDITELKQREQELVRSQNLMRNVVDASFDGIIVMNGQGTVIDYSAAAEEVFGWTAAEIIGQRMSSFLMPHRHRAAHDEGLERYLKTGHGPVLGKRIEIEGQHKDGHEIMVELAIRQTKGEHGPLFLGYVRDITERKAADVALRDAKERAEAANEAKAKFLAMMSHEIRTPMNGVLGILSLLRDTDLDPEQASYVKTARDSGRSLLELINDILDFSKLEAGRMELDDAPFRLTSVVKGIVDLFRPIAEEKQLDMTLAFADGLPRNVIGDAGRLRQVLLNLVANAVKFTEVGSIAIEVSVEAHDLVRPAFRFKVKDTGIGIAEDKHETLFGDFVTVDSSYTKRQGGTGLGLAICQRIAALMGGQISLDSHPGLGSTFEFIVPMWLAEDQGPIRQPEPDVKETNLSPGLIILLAEDNATNQIVVSHALAQAGCDVDIANNGREAVQAATMRDYDCIIMDVSMPEMDGLEATKRIKAGNRNATTPIIALTAYALRGDKETLLQAGMDDFLSKPVEKEDLLAAIAHNMTRPEPNVDREMGLDSEQEAAPPVLQTARSILETMPDDMKKRLLQQFINDTVERRDQAMQAARDGDLMTLERATHALKSVAGTFGADNLNLISTEINSLARQEKSVAAFRKTDQLSPICVETFLEVQQLAEELGITLA